MQKSKLGCRERNRKSKSIGTQRQTNLRLRDGMKKGKRTYEKGRDRSRNRSKDEDLMQRKRRKKERERMREEGWSKNTKQFTFSFV